jgi:hypothetical protein
MVHKPFAISVIASVALAGILTLSILAGISLTNQAFGAKPTELTLNVSPDTQGASSYQLTGKLTSEGEGLAGKEIELTSSTQPGVGKLGITKTGPDGSYSFTTTLPSQAIIHVSAWYLGFSDSRYNTAHTVQTLAR